MLISEYLQMRNISVTTGNPSINNNPSVDKNTPPQDSPFAKTLKEQLDKSQNNGVEFSSHAIKRLEDRSVDLSEDNRLERLNKAVQLANEKGSQEALVLVDQTAFIVSVKNNKVITTLPTNDLKGNIFTNIDSTVIM